MTTMNTSNITFRSKFEKLLNDQNRSIIVTAFEKFRTLTYSSALNHLWRLTYSTESASDVLSELGLNLEILSLESISSFRNELRFQYEKVYPGFLEVFSIPEECAEAFTSLSNHTDSIVAKVVYEHCQSRVYAEEAYTNRLLFLLKSDKENNYFGGIRCLHFNMEESAYLKPFHMLIHDLLKAMYERYQHQRGTSTPNKPFAALGNQLKEAGIELPFDMSMVPSVKYPADEPVQIHSKFKPLTPEEILAHKDVFTPFVNNDDLNTLLQIGKLGFDLNKVMAKKEEISNLLQAAKAKEEADANLLKATEALSN